MGSEPAGTALIVSLDGETRERCSAMLTRVGFDVRTAVDREAALTMFAQGGIDVIVASAPEVDGSALLQAIRKFDERLPVIFVTEWPDFSQVPNLAKGSTGKTPAEKLRSAVVTAAVSYQVGRSRKRP